MSYFEDMLFDGLYTLMHHQVYVHFIMMLYIEICDLFVLMLYPSAHKTIIIIFIIIMARLIKCSAATDVEFTTASRATTTISDHHHLEVAKLNEVWISADASYLTLDDRVTNFLELTVLLEFSCAICQSLCKNFLARCQSLCKR